MEHLQKLRADLKKIDGIESPFLKDLASLLYFPSLQHPSIPSQLIYSFQTEENWSHLWEQLTELIHQSPPFQKKYLPLGKYAECLLLFYFNHQQEFELLAHNLQLNEDKITLGELDYFFANRNQKYIHLELAVKFYLKVNFKGSIVYLGPSTRDWMQRKLDKLLYHQLVLPHHRKDLLPKPLDSLSFHSQLYLKGSLFLPFTEWEEEERNPLNLGWWIPIEMLSSLLEETSLCYLITQKSDWLFPFKNTLPLFEKQEALSFAQEWLLERNELMLCRLNSEGEVIDRGFVMRSGWPENAL